MSQVIKSFGNETYKVIYPVLPEHDGIRLDQFLMQYFSSFSRQNVKRKIQLGEVQINSRPFPHKPSVKVYHGETVKVLTFNKGLEDEFWNGRKLRLESPQIVFEDENMLIVNKPAFMATHPTGKHLFNCATVFYENIFGHTIHSIHRLDRETSGCLILGKNPKATNQFTNYFENGQVRKCYFLICHKKSNKTFPFDATENLGQIENFKPRQFMHCFPEGSEEGKHALTHFELVEDCGEYALMLAFPHTGRQHQIRAHASFHGFHLLGDKMYNDDPTIFMRFKDGEATTEDHQQMQIPRQALHATALYFPKSSYKTYFRAPLPQDLMDWMELKLYVDIEQIEQKIESKISEYFLQVTQNS